MDKWGQESDHRLVAIDLVGDPDYALQDREVEDGRNSSFILGNPDCLDAQFTCISSTELGFAKGVFADSAHLDWTLHRNSDLDELLSAWCLPFQLVYV